MTFSISRWWWWHWWHWHLALGCRITTDCPRISVGVSSGSGSGSAGSPPLVASVYWLRYCTNGHTMATTTTAGSITCGHVSRQYPCTCHVSIVYLNLQERQTEEGKNTDVEVVFLCQIQQLTLVSMSRLLLWVCSVVFSVSRLQPVSVSLSQFSRYEVNLNLIIHYCKPTSSSTPTQQLSD